MVRPSDGAVRGSENEDDQLAPQTRLGEYEIETVLGSGGMGTVYAAWHPILRSRAAIKVLNRDVSHNAATVDRFIREAQAASRITHPYIIKVFGFGELPDGRKYFVMEYLEGETLTSWLARGRPDREELLRLLLQVCEALEAAHHEGIIHRDLKPDNLWIARPKHGLPYIKILDFGIAKAAEPTIGEAKTKTGSVLGTPQFMSPEQCTGRGVDHRTDIYAMGGILYCIFCGRPPFERGSSAELVAAHLYDTVIRPSAFADVPPRLEALILACLEKDPDKRPGSAAELGRLLREAMGPLAPREGRPVAKTAKLQISPTLEAGDPADAEDGPGKLDPADARAELRERPSPRRVRPNWVQVTILAAMIGGSVTAGLVWKRQSAKNGSPSTQAPQPVAKPVEQPGPHEPATLPGEQAADLASAKATMTTDSAKNPPDELTTADKESEAAKAQTTKADGDGRKTATTKPTAAKVPDRKVDDVRAGRAASRREASSRATPASAEPSVARPRRRAPVEPPRQSPSPADHRSRAPSTTSRAADQGLILENPFR